MKPLGNGYDLIRRATRLFFLQLILNFPFATNMSIICIGRVQSREQAVFTLRKTYSAHHIIIYIIIPTECAI